MFTTKEDIDEYFSGETVVCLICGKKYKSLTPHIKAKHKMSAREYKKDFGLPLSRGLNSENFHNNMSQVKKEEYASGIGSSGCFARDKKILAKALAHCIRSKEPKQQFFKNMLRDKNSKIDETIVLKIRERMIKQDRSLKDVCNDNDIPSLHTYYKYLRIMRSKGINIGKIDTTGRRQSKEHINRRISSKMKSLQGGTLKGLDLEG